ncbi:penicillin acylase family protein [Shewanella donghaensis]|uniref:penicillin acylase family protein n=1 Tax=Shewanella donghaensis TaxID=238836 RepID=UPI0011824D21|nr:penicillin acylase family protein [Shewanella donghaensis]
MSISLAKVLQSKITQYTVTIIVLLFMLTLLAIYAVLRLSMPDLNAQISSKDISSKVTIERDQLGSAIITANSRLDASYALGYAHSQDRFFQMDLLRRNAAGELSEIFGPMALERDKSRRFHQLRKRSQTIFDGLPLIEKNTLTAYTKGVNAALNDQNLSSFEYLLTSSIPRPWHETDSILVIYSMYLDLQGNTIKRDMALTQLQDAFGQEMLEFITQASHHQVSLDYSQVPYYEGNIPELESQLLAQATITEIPEPLEVGSNNWAVTGQLTQSGHAMLSDDMHLSFAVPIIWYRAQLNYPLNTDNTDKTPSKSSMAQVTGVSLPGAPAIVVGSNGKLAWGFTNSYVDTADWVEIDDNTEINIEYEPIQLPESEIMHTVQVTEFGPIKSINNKNYALAWVAHQDFAVNMTLLSLEQATSVDEAALLASSIGIPAQNMLIVDSKGNAGWKIAGALPARSNPANTAQVPQEVQTQAWQQQRIASPSFINPQDHRIWTANSRVISTRDLAEFGDGGYALGARAEQIRDRLHEQEQFNESDFFNLQLDNEARFLQPWQKYLLTLLSQQPKAFAEDIKFINQWGNCACADSVGYTLVRHFRTTMIDNTFAPIETQLTLQDSGLSVIKSVLETPMWQLIQQQPQSWLPTQHNNWDDFAISAYQQARTRLLDQHSEENNLSDLRWGEVNRLAIKHPFSKQMPLLSQWLDMPSVQGYGDSFMPAVQRESFGASQRFIVQPGNEQDAIMSIPGGQSGHPLSPYYRSGYKQYVRNDHTPLLPLEIEHKLVINPL